ncbi:hypothetical protein IW261DRAFT_797208 [Armillaria novae-zelandiae]|uniref:TRP C-terminal domain-containing protein n=1 Tax=Armillaria novae-zelandiae TaxID=153914 RepID=A0AA39PLE1_9AGAR|nr:hypothetical protein IW261DRAFT_797208 [Armillaria novae-zelandiae]
MLIPYFCALTTLILCTDARQPAELFDAFEDFIAGLLQPSSAVVSGNSSALSPDVVGRVNMMMTLNGIKNNTEFLYGVPMEVIQANTTQIIGYPTNASVESLSIQHYVVSASVVFSMYHATMSLTTPLQVDLWLNFDDDLLISAYDLTIRNLPKAFSFLASVLSEQIAHEMPVGNSTDAASSRMAADICMAATEFCTGGNQQYDSYDSCFETLSRNVTMDSLDQSFCRYFVKDMVPSRPSIHCPSLGPSGGDMCFNANFAEETTTYPFASSFVAANVSSGGTEELSDDIMVELMRFDMQVIYPTTVAFYSISAFLYLLLLYVNGKGVDFLLDRFSKEYAVLSFDNKRNVVTYCLNTFWTTVAFILQIVASPMLGGYYTWDRIGEARMAAVIISGLYIYEMVFRPSMRWTLLVHHFCTLFATIFIQVALQIALHPAIASAGLIWLFQATTEQSVFIGLILYRLRFPKHVAAPVLKFSAVQSFICKIASAIYLLVWWGIKLAKFHRQIDVALSVMLVLLISVLMATQIQGSYAVWCIAKNMHGQPSKPVVIPGPSYWVNDSFHHEDRGLGRQASESTLRPLELSRVLYQVKVEKS